MVWLPTEIPTIEEEDELTKGLQKSCSVLKLIVTGTLSRYGANISTLNSDLKENR
jgi:hypothetical protein